MRTAGEDRRVRRTRRLLHQALLELVAEHGYDRVTVQDVLDRADVGRATFYAHFRDKDDLLVSGFATLREAMRGAMARGGSDHATSALFEHIAEHRWLYRALVSSRASAVVLRQVREELVALTVEHFRDMLSAHRRVPSIPLELTAEHTVGALLAVATWWLDHPAEYTVEQIAGVFERLTLPSLQAALGEPS